MVVIISNVVYSWFCFDMLVIFVLIGYVVIIGFIMFDGDFLVFYVIEIEGGWVL